MQTLEALSLDELVAEFNRLNGEFTTNFAEAIRHIRSAALHRYRIGGVLCAAKKLVEANKVKKAWPNFVKSLGVSQNWDYVSRKLFERIDSEKDLEGYNLQDALEMAGIVKERKEPGTNGMTQDDPETNGTGTNGTTSATPQNRLQLVLEDKLSTDPDLTGKLLGAIVGQLRGVSGVDASHLGLIDEGIALLAVLRKEANK